MPPSSWASSSCLPPTGVSSSTIPGATARLAFASTRRRASVEAIVAAARHAPFQGVLAVGDRPAVLAARVAARLGLPGHTPDAAAASGNKLETRRRLAAAELAVPSYFTLPAGGDGTRAAADARIEFPCVLKPLGLSGSRGVIRADSRQEFASAFARISALLARVDVRAARTGLENIILVERFIPGREFAVEGVLTAGTLQVLAIFDKPDPLDGPFFEETIYVTPTALDAASQRHLVATIQQASDAIGLRHGPVHAECRIGPRGHRRPRSRGAADRRVVLAGAAICGWLLARACAAAARAWRGCLDRDP